MFSRLAVQDTLTTLTQIIPCARLLASSSNHSDILDCAILGVLSIGTIPEYLLFYLFLDKPLTYTSWPYFWTYNLMSQSFSRHCPSCMVWAYCTTFLLWSKSFFIQATLNDDLATWARPKLMFLSFFFCILCTAHGRHNKITALNAVVYWMKQTGLQNFESHYNKNWFYRKMFAWFNMS